MALERLRGIFRRQTPKPVLPLTFLRDHAWHVFIHIVKYLDMAGLVALARTDQETYKCLLPILKEKKERVWSLLVSVDEDWPTINRTSFGRVIGRQNVSRHYCLCRRPCRRKPRSGDALKSVFPLLGRMRHDLRGYIMITLIASDNYFVIYRITSNVSRQCCDNFPLQVVFVRDYHSVIV